MEDTIQKYSAKCNNCSWTGPFRDIEEEAQRDLEDHKRQMQPMQHEGVILRVPVTGADPNPQP